MTTILGGAVIDESGARVVSLELGAPAADAADSILDIELRPEPFSVPLIEEPEGEGEGEGEPIVIEVGQPDVPRALVVAGKLAGQVGDVVIHGKSIGGEPISETFALDGDTPVPGALAFKEIDRIDLPAAGDGEGEPEPDGAGVTVGTLDVLGLPLKLTRNTVLHAFYDNVRETVAPTVTVDPDTLAANTIMLDTALSGAGVIVALYEAHDAVVEEE